MTAPKSPPPDLPGFTFREGIGAGGFADVFLYTQHSTERAVAVKVLRTEHLSARNLDQFRVEANVMAGLSAHPYIVMIHDAGIAPDGRPFLVMEHYPLPHFGVRARGGRLAVAEVLKVGVQLCSAVESAHRADILHRDIKPANVLTSTYGDPGLTDFGIAGVQNDGELAAAAGVSIGFSAPEVVLDDTSTGSRASDVFALAATLYALIEGRSMIFVPGGDNRSPALNQRAATATVVPFARSDVPRPVEHLLRTALAREPDHRPTTAVALGRSIQDIEQGLHLPPTQLVLLDAAPSSARADHDEDEDRTRQRIRTVDPAGPSPNPAPSRPMRYGTGSTAASPPPAPLDRRPEPGRPHADEGETVARVPAPAAAAVEPDHDPTDTRPKARLLAAGGAVALAGVVALVALVALGGDRSSGETPTTSGAAARQVTPQDPTMGGFVGPPSNVRATFEPDGSLVVTWEPPGEPANADADAFRYRVEPSGPDAPSDTFGEDALDLEEARFVVPADLVAPAGQDTCVDVSALLGRRISEPPARVCADSP